MRRTDLSRSVFFVFAALSASAAACGTTTSSPATAPDDASSHLATDASATGATGATEAADGGVSFDLSGEMSFTQNPNGPWSYGYSSGPTLSDATFVLDTFTADAPPGSFWHPGNADAGGAYYPYIAQNTTDASAYGSSMGWSARAHEVTMEASNSGQYAIARFVAPLSGSFALTFHAEGVHFGLSSTDVQITKNDVSLFSANIEGYGGDPSFHAIVGASPTADFSTTLTLAAGDVLFFALGYGANHTNNSDTTGMSVHLNKL